MTKERAIREAREAAASGNLTMVVTYNPFGENSVPDNYGFCPKAALGCFPHEEVIETIVRD